MLKQILELMYIEPELLAELDEEQKQLLFFKMREEQVRRWKLREDEMGDKDIKFPSNFTKKPRKPKGSLKVSFVMELNSDKPRVTFIEGHVAGSSHKVEESSIENKTDRIVTKEVANIKPSPNAKPQHLTGFKVGDSPSRNSKRMSQEIDRNETRTSSTKSFEIEDDVKKLESNWKEREILIKEHDERKKHLLEKVRELGRSESTMDIRESRLSHSKDSSLPPLSAPVSFNRSLGFSAKPESKSSIVKWFKELEVPRGAGRIPTSGEIAEWFHGIISREDSEKLLTNKPVGSFLIRVSDKIWGYTVSYKSIGKCKHFLVDASPACPSEDSKAVAEGPYRFFGAYAITHDSLFNFVQHYRKTPISMSGCELLINPCGQTNPKDPDYKELFE